MSIKLWLTLGIAAILASGVGYSLFLRHQVSEAHLENKALSEALTASEKELSIQIKLRRADSLAVQTRTVIVKQIETKEVQGRAITEKALQANHAWSDAPVPADVIDSLRD